MKALYLSWRNLLIYFYYFPNQCLIRGINFGSHPVWPWDSFGPTLTLAQKYFGPEYFGPEYFGPEILRPGILRPGYTSARRDFSPKQLRPGEYFYPLIYFCPETTSACLYTLARKYFGPLHFGPGTKLSKVSFLTFYKLRRCPRVKLILEWKSWKKMTLPPSSLWIKSRIFVTIAWSCEPISPTSFRVKAITPPSQWHLLIIIAFSVSLDMIYIYNMIFVDDFARQIF